MEVFKIKLRTTSITTKWDVSTFEARFMRAKKVKSVLIMPYKQATERAAMKYLQAKSRGIRLE